MSDVKSVEANDDRKLYQHQMLLPKGKFELQSIEADQEDDQEADQDLAQTLLRSGSDPEQEPDANENSAEEVISIQDQIIAGNRTNQLCFDIRIAMEQNRRTCQGIGLDNCKVLDGVLWKDDRLWVPQSMVTRLIREAHDLPVSGHPGMNRTLDLLRRSYCWPKMRSTIKRDIRNCYVCRRS